jgi:hypothetical protein
VSPSKEFALDPQGEKAFLTLPKISHLHGTTKIMAPMTVTLTTLTSVYYLPYSKYLVCVH